MMKEKGWCIYVFLGKADSLNNGKTGAIVCPFFVSNDSMISGVNGVYNAVEVMGDPLGNVMFYGQGAGRYPTAYNVVQDCVDILSGKGFYCSYGEKVKLIKAKKQDTKEET